MSDDEPGLRPAYTATDFFAEHSGGWVTFWQDYLDGRHLVARNRENPTVEFARKTAAALKEVVERYEADQAAERRR